MSILIQLSTRRKPLSPLFVRTEYDADNPSERIITWQPPGAGRVDRYEIVYSPPIGTPPPPIYVPGSGVFLRQVITGLDPAQIYQFIITAEAGIGPDEIRTRSDPAIDNIPDEENRKLTVENYGHYAIEVAWPDLPGDFESYVISYEPYDEYKPNVRPSPVEIGQEYGITSLNIYGLVPGEEYTIYLQTKTRLQVSPIIQQVTQTTIPLPIDEIHVDLVTASSFVFSWDDAYGIKDQYQVFFEPIADENNPAPAMGSLPSETFHPATGGLTSVEVTDLEPAQEYRIAVVTWSNNESSSRTSVIATTRPFPPNFIEILDTTTNSALIQWYDGEVGNLGISRYQIEIVPRDSTRLAVIAADSESNTYRITGLTAGRPYQALIQSIVVDANGNDLESLPVSVAFVTVPLPPIGKGQPTINSTSITIRWQSGGGDLTSFSLEYSPIPENPLVQSPIIVYPSSNLELTISGLSAKCLTYTVFYTTLPNPVLNLRVTGTTSTSVGLAWEAPEGPVDQYHLFISNVGGPQPSRPISINPNVPLVYDVTGLNPYSDYHFQIVNVVDGVQSLAATVTARTGEDVPGAPGGLLVTQLSPNSIHVEWEPPESPNGELQGYVLVITRQDLSSRRNNVSEEIELPLDQLWYQFDDLSVGYEYTFAVVVVNNVGLGAPYHLGLFVQLRETAPPHTGQAPYRTPDTERNEAYSISITLREDFFLPIFGRVANYSILVAEEPNPRKDEISLSQVGEPPQTYHVSSTQHVWPSYQASPPGYNPFIKDIAKRQVGGGQGQDLQAEFVIGTEEDCPDDQFYYCNGWLKSYTYYRVAIRAYGLDGNYTDTPWSEPLSTGFDVLWFVYALVAVIVFVVLCFIIFLCVCCGRCGSPGENDFFEDSKKDKHMLMIKNISRTSPMASKHKKDFTNYCQAPSHRAPWRRAPMEQSYQTPESKHQPPSSRAEPHKPTAKLHVYASPTSQWSKPIYVDQFGEHMRMMNARGGIRYTEELNKLNDIGANLPCNAASNAPEKNRYRNILPYDTNRVCLHDPPDGLDYINASYVDGHHGNNEYIVAQGPLPNTVEDFWEMVWENEIPTIIMNTNLVENGRVKCEKYWPDSGEAQYGRMTVKLISESDTQEWTVRTFELSKDGESKGHVRIFQYRNWPDQGAPQDPSSVLKFLQTVLRAQHPRRSGPGIVVHCSAGVGRSGTFVAIDILLHQLAAGNSETLDVFGVCAKLRRQRRYMVQSEEQYKFVHRAVQVYMQQQANYEVMMDGGSNWAMGTSASGAGPTAYSNAGTSIDEYL
ncbi:tyrosine-protein phosphatase 10D-like [Amphiura filiformis]|uniref:tyrosine-protein phosphatase 10D-like n=1 Tax=Amphiura filiformis TaxID=82378 RepID=UPI003B21029E